MIAVIMKIMITNKIKTMVVIVQTSVSDAIAFTIPTSPKATKLPSCKFSKIQLGWMINHQGDQ